MLVKLNDDEYEKISGRAAAAGLTSASFLALLGIQDVPDSAAPAKLTDVQLRALAAELYAIKRILRGAGTNLNQMAATANTTGEIDPTALLHAARAIKTQPRLDALLDEIRQVFPW
ncbi:mobilisation protein (MobC) [Lentzea albidocapillata subsp. violacea]|uniref:Mobilisation protein (MobC) n=1 Tax=Lentzea albidocapillata subsp. violacea TaxID=128104 RepID=A0A1G9YYM9_9PSEU|nr:mobilisation protein (MobC) [Lentzea albidocapillata subsp. violacea]